MIEKPIVTRYKNNPILKAEDIPYQVSTVHNAGMTKYQDKYIMLFRSHLHNGRSVIGLAESDDGFNFTSRSKPFLVPSGDGVFGEYEEAGVEDARVACIEGIYYITYSAYSRHGVRIGLARTTDFETVEKVSLITEADLRNVVLFPEKINGLYVRMDRPHSEISPWSIWVSYSPDLIYWGDARVIIKPLTYHWDEMKIGPGATPIKTGRGWLNIYHGVFHTMAGAVYRLGVALHDLSDPAKLIAVSDKWILEPRDSWERTGYVSNVVFTCGAIPEDDGKVKIYWGGADTVMCVGIADIEALVQLCLDNPRSPL